jgi:hypothetical protein
MDIRKLPGAVNQDRRRFLGVAAGAVATAQLPLLGAGTARAATQGTQAASRNFGPVKQIEAGVLDVGYVEAEPANGPAVILMHGSRTTSTAMPRLRPCWRLRVTT